MNYFLCCGRPITQQPGGNLDAPLKSISERLNAQPEQVPLAWAKATGAVVVTYVPERRTSNGIDCGCLARAQSENVSKGI